MKVLPVPVNADNYAYLLVDERQKVAAAVDPCEPEKVLQAAKEGGFQVNCVLTTHHHWDHAGGNKLMATKIPGIPIYGGDDRVEGLTNKVKQDDELKIGTLVVSVLSAPCHTSGHVLYLAKDTANPSEPHSLFTGDTLFIGGCGRFFEGTASQMYQNLCKTVASLSGNTRVFCGHEYTLKNLQFAAFIEPNNPAVQEKLKWARECRERGVPTVPSTVEEEKSYNPFMRVDHESVAEALGMKGKQPIEIMKELRQRKDNF